MNYYISDLHLFCEDQIDNGGPNYDGRPYKNLEEMHTAIMERWNSKVTERDRVYILGDVAMRTNRASTAALILMVSQLNGQKVLIKGNHDDVTNNMYRDLFQEICDYKEIYESFDGTAYRLVLSHYPILMWNGQHKGAILLYGHTHNTIEDAFFQECIAKMNATEGMLKDYEPKVKAINVGCMKDYMDYTPRSLSELLAEN